MLSNPVLRPCAFQSTLSVRRATRNHLKQVVKQLISIHALREESDYSGLGGNGVGTISIHALREESDLGDGEWRGFVCDFNPRSP